LIEGKIYNLNTSEIINNRHYSSYPDEIKKFYKNKEFQKAEEILIQIIEIMEKNALETGNGVAPWYYEKLASVYRTTKQKDKQISTIIRFLIQPKARGASPRKIYEKYLNFFPEYDENELQEIIYKSYIKNINKSKASKTNF
jgi:hypothetical protein